MANIKTRTGQELTDAHFDGETRVLTKEEREAAYSGKDHRAFDEMAQRIKKISERKRQRSH